jgi:hypothetical protein
VFMMQSVVLDWLEARLCDIANAAGHQCGGRRHRPGKLGSRVSGQAVEGMIFPRGSFLNTGVA